MSKISRRDFLKFIGAGAFVLIFGRLFQHVQSLPSSNSTSHQIQYISNNLVSSYKETLPVILTCPETSRVWFLNF